MPGTLKHTQKHAPWTDCITILMCQHAGYLMQMRKIVNNPCGQKLRKRYHSQ